MDLIDLGLVAFILCCAVICIGAVVGVANLLLSRWAFAKGQDAVGESGTRPQR